ncbi:MAG TPA: dynamin family protein, partial [Chloroflexia bacterium]|nr:dynamin family protein [Chloroflexia bacterium]
MTTPAAPWTCPQCGHTNRPGSRFCSRCRTANPGTASGPAGVATRRGDAPVGADGAGPEAEIRAAGRLLLETVGTVPPEGLEQWLLLRYQRLPAIQGLAEQVNALQLPEWGAERGYVGDFLQRAGDQLNPAKRYAISFLGRNGLGKSTLANALLGASYMPEAFREPVTAAVTRVRAWRDRPGPDELRRQGTTPDQAQVYVEYFNEATFLTEVLNEYYRRLAGLPGVNLAAPATLDNAALNAVRQARNKLRDNPEAAANAATLDSMLEAYLHVRTNLPPGRWLTYEQARRQINEKEAQGVERDLLRVTREVVYYVDDTMTPDPLLATTGIELIDLPGLEADVSYHEQTTMRALNEADAVIVVLQARRPVEKNTLAALDEL